MLAILIIISSVLGHQRKPRQVGRTGTRSGTGWYLGTVSARVAAGREGPAVGPGRGEVKTLIPSQSFKLITLPGHPEGAIVESVGQVTQVIFGQQIILLVQIVIWKVELLANKGIFHVKLDLAISDLVMI